MHSWLDEKLYRYTGSSVYPFHIPGSKRQAFGMQGDVLRYDITEIEGFDDLRNPSGILKDLQDEWAALYNAERAFLSVNGSTGSNLAVLFAAAGPKEKVAIADGCHESIANAAHIRGWDVCRIPVGYYPEGFHVQVDPYDVEKVLFDNRDVRTVVLTSPTYEGVFSDTGSISEVVHRYGASLVVDSAHGAHLGIKGMDTDYFPWKNPVMQGADAAVVSLHKTLPVLGQVSLILVPKDGKIDPDTIKLYLNMVQTSSPSYVLMSSASCGLRFLLENAGERSVRHAGYLESFYRDTAGLRSLKVLRRENSDNSKIIVSTADAGITGEALMKRLRDGYSLELEKAGERYVLAITTIMDTEEGFIRLKDALYETDSSLQRERL